MWTWILYICVYIVRAEIFHEQLHRQSGQPRLIEKLKFGDNERKRRAAWSNEEQVPSWIKEHELNEATHNQALIHWNGNKGDSASEIMFILTRNKRGNEIIGSELWISTDYGSSWRELDKELQLETDTEPNVLLHFMMSPIDTSRSIFTESPRSPHQGKYIWTTDNEGSTFSHHQLPEGFLIDEIKYHPSESTLLLGYDRLKRNLWVSSDFAASWTLISSHVTPGHFFWFEEKSDKNEHLNDERESDEFGDIDVKRLVHFEKEMKDESEEVTQGIYEFVSCLIPHCTPAGGRYKELNDQSKMAKVAENSLIVRDDYIFFERAKGALTKLFVSYQRGDFVEADFPPEVSQTDYHVISSDQGFVLLAVNHQNGLTQLFSSESRGQVYRPVLRNLRYFSRKQNTLFSDTVFAADVHDVKGLDGCFIANQFLATESATVNQTVITWDAGKTWSKLATPYHQVTYSTEETKWEKMNVLEGQHLNLHLEHITTDGGMYAPSIQTKESAPGYIIAHGSVGITLENHPARFGLFISSDAGRTWNETLSGRYALAMSDSGAITTVVPMQTSEKYSSLRFSKSNGNDWQRIKFSEAEVTIDAVLTEPGELTKVVTIFAHAHYSEAWKIYTVDFSSQGDDCPSEAYEMWKYSKYSCEDERNLLGMEIELKRRKESEQCFNGKQFNRTRTAKPCENCKLKDYFCQEGWKVTEDNNCKKIDTTTPDDDFFPKQNFKPIKAPGNKCKSEFNWASTPPLASNSVDIIVDSLDGQLLTNHKQVHFEVGHTLILSFTGQAQIGSTISWSIITPCPQSLRYRTDTPCLKRFTVSKPSITLDRPGNYMVKLTVNGKTDQHILRAFSTITRARLFCPPMLKPGESGEFKVKLSSRNYEWVNLDYTDNYGPVSYEWFGDFPETYIQKNMPSIQANFDDKKDSVKTIVVAVSTQFNSFEEKCDILVTDSVEVLAFNLNINNTELFLASNDDFIKEFNLVVLKAIHENVKVYSLIHNGRLKIDVYTPPQDHVSWVYVYITRKATSELDLAEARVQIAKLLTESFTLKLASTDVPHALASVDYIDKNGDIQPVSTGSTGRAGHIIGFLLLIFVLVPTLYYGARWAYEKHQTMRYRTLASFGRQTEDQVAIISDEQTENDATVA